MIMKEPLDSELNFIALASTIGHSVLIETLKMAAYFATHSNHSLRNVANFNGRMKEASYCFAFVQGTGLELIINRFGLAYNPDAIRDGFNYYVRH